MKLGLYSIAIVIVMGGCAGLQPKEGSAAHSSGMKDTNASVTSSVPPFCPTTMPQDMEMELPDSTLKVGDLVRFSQSIAPYVDQSGEFDHDALLPVQYRFEQLYFTPWANCTPPMKADDVAWPLRAFKGGFGSNLRPVEGNWFEEMKEQAHFDAYGTLNRKGIALRWMDIRALPTEKPLYRDPSLPGEGYPFDLLQNSTLNYGEPVYISHTSQDGAWSYIFSNSVSGWVKTDGIAVLDDAAIERYLQKEKLFITQDHVPLYDESKRFVTYGRIGMVLVMESEEAELYWAVAFDSEGYEKRLSIPKTAAHVGISRLNRDEMNRLASQMLNNTYGWGGMYGERDCSSMIRDLYTPFGIWLPRNSSAQAKKGEIVSFEGLSDDEKLALIKAKGIPFETIIYLKGHVLLYIGLHEGSVMVLHNIWGIRTIDPEGKKGRHIIGKAVISTLDLGSELDNFDPANRLLSRALSMNIFTHTPLFLSKGKKGKAP